MTTTMMIEASSPLAAMQQSSLYFNRCGFGSDALSYASFARSNFGPESFNFKDLSMVGRSRMDYFNMPPPVRGSSPTASLAADLSQNMNIDRSSPQYPTPRRALFGGPSTFNAFNALTTPPVSSSSPAPLMDNMDMSPLPHKPVRSIYNLELQSPTPEHTPTGSLFPECFTPRSSSPAIEEPMQLQLPQERRKSNPIRPSMTRAKCLSTTSIPSRAHPEAQLPPFRFGGAISRSNPASTLTLSEIWEASSPVSDKTASPPVKVAQPNRLRQPFVLPTNSRNASPLGQHSRKMSNPLLRPRKIVRRSLSMFEHPDELMRGNKGGSSPSLPSIQDHEVPQHQLELPHFFTDNDTCDLPRISRDTMIDILDGKYDNQYEQRVVIDCRFEYEYSGGHIQGAVNFNNKDELTAQLFNHEKPGKALLIFHCEYSAHRAPLMAKHIRGEDRKVNQDNYPQLTYPEAYVLDGGYSAFYGEHAQRCYPQNYVEMHAKEHVDACEAGMAHVKQQQRPKLARAQTFAMGQHSPAFDSSPVMRRGCNDDMEMDLGLDFTPVPVRPSFNALQANRGQRMLSY